MKTMIKNIAIILLLTISSQSCLDVDVQNFTSPEIYYNTEEELNNALTGVYGTLKSGDTYSNAILGRMGLDADQGYNRNQHGAKTVGMYNTSTSDLLVSNYWAKFYAGIYQANLLLENIDRVSSLEKEKRDIIRGEALFLRAYFHFMLVQNFDDVPLILESTKSVSAQDYQVKRTPAKEVYERIIQDMETASHLVESIEDIGHAGRINKSAVYGILTRVCLYMAGNPINEKSKYQDAHDWAKKLIDLSYHELNPSFQKVFENLAQDVYETRESIWEVEFWGSGTGIYSSLSGKVGLNNGIFNNFDAEIGLAPTYIASTAYTYNVFKTDNDLRRSWTVAPFYYRNPGNKVAVKVNYQPTQLFNRSCGKFRRESEVLLPKSTGTSPQNYPLLRYSDILLMFAEAVNELNDGPTTEAYEAINQVRRRGYGKDINTADNAIDLKNLDYQGFMAELQDERTRELAFESLRKADLVRWGIFLPNMKQRLEEANAHIEFPELKWAKHSFSSVSPRDVLWPIPAREITLNKNLTQNKGW